MEPTIAIDPSVVWWSEPITPDRPLLVLLHGRGADEVDLAGIAPFLSREPVIASLRAPLSEGPGYSWYPMSTLERATAFTTDVEQACAAVLAWLDAQPRASSVGLLGFSQGGAMALELIRERPQRLAFAVMLSGYVIDGQRRADVELERIRPPVFWGRGVNDPVISEIRLQQTAEWLPSHSDLDERTYIAGHSITEGELADVRAFVDAHFSRP
jgi:phospholipase/carboxylesterase